MRKIMGVDIMLKKLTLSSEEIVNKDFSLQYKGYVPQEVDAFLDEVVKNYEIIEEIRDYYETQNKALQKTNSVLRSKIDELETKLEMEKSKSNSIEKVDSTSNLDLIKKIAKLESELFQTKKELEEAKK